MKTKRLLIVTIQMAVILCSLSAQESRSVLRPLPRNNLCNSITAMVSDDYGFVWIGTVQGLFRYDAYTYKSFTDNIYDTLPISQNIIRTIHKDNSGNIWIGTDIGASVYDNKSGLFININGDIKNRTVNNFSQISDNTMLVGTTTGAMLVDRMNFNSIKLNDDINDNLLFSSKDSKDNVWFGGLNGFYKITIKNGAIERKESWQKTRQLGFFDIDPHDNIWFCDGEEVHKIHIEDNMAHNRSTGTGLKAEAKNILFDGNRVYIATHYKGLNIFETDNKGAIVKRVVMWIDEPNRNRISNSLTSIMRDKMGNIWIGTVDGIFILKKDTPSQFKIIDEATSNLSHNVVSSVICGDDGSLWVSTADGLNKISFADDEKLNITAFRNMSARDNTILDNRMQTSVIDAQGVIYVGTKRSVSKFNTATNRFIYDDTVESFVKRIDAKSAKSVFKGKNGDIWLGFLYGGIVAWRDNQFFQIRIDQCQTYNLNVLTIEQDDDGNLWFGTKLNGIFCISASELKQVRGSEIVVHSPKRYRKKSTVDGLSSNTVNILYRSSSNYIYAGTNEGLYRYNKSKDDFTRVTLNIPDNNDYITTIIEDKSGILWVFTNTGVYRYDDSCEEIPLYFELNKGYFARIDYVMAGCLDKQGRIFVGGINGVTYFDPQRVTGDTTNNIVYISNFSILNKEVGPDSRNLSKPINDNAQITLTHDDSHISFEFTTLDYDIPRQQIKYCYRLEGFDTEWIYISGNRNYIAYSNLPSGNYILKVRATNRTGMWSDITRNIPIVVLPPWWATWWSYCLYILFSSALILATLYIIKQRYRYKQNERLNQWKQSFYINITHGFKTPLALLRVPLDALLEESGDMNESQRNSMLQIMNKNVHKLSHLINQLIEFRQIDRSKASLNLVRVDIMSFASAICKSFSTLYESKGLRLTICADDAYEITFDPEKIETVIFNLMMNAYTYTHSSGEITVCCKKMDTAFVFSVSDTGIGIKKEDQKRIFERFWRVKEESNLIPEGSGIGLALSKDIVELHYGSIDVDSKYGVGSTFSFTLPIKAPHKRQYVNSEISVEELLKPILSHRHVSMEQDVAISITEDVIHSEKIVLLSSDNDMINILKFIFKNYNLDYYLNCDSALNAIYDTPPQLIITDTIASNKRVGIDFARALKENMTTMHIPIIFITAEDNRDDILELYKIGIDSFMEKPFDKRVLLARAQQLLKSRISIRESLKIDMLIEAKATDLSSTDTVLINRAMEVIEKNISNEDFNLNDFAQQMMISRTALHAKIKALSKKSPMEMLRHARMQRASQLLLTQAYNITQVGYMVGFSDSRYFSTSFKKQFGISPSEYVERESS